MVKHTTKTSQHGAKRPSVLFVFILLAIALVAGLALASGPISQRFERIRAGMQARDAFQQQRSALKGPLSELGLNTNDKVKSTCIKELVAGYSKPQLVCVVLQKQYVVVKSKAAINNAVAAADRLDKTLSVNAWTNYKNAAPSYKVWLGNVTSGQTWLPDEPSYKYTGNARCDLDLFDTYSKPNPPAYSLLFSCTTPAKVVAGGTD